jgi:hypothetical protein
MAANFVDAPGDCLGMMVRGRNRGLSGSSASLAFGRSPNEDLCHPIGEFVKVDGFPHPRCTFQHGWVTPYDARPFGCEAVRVGQIAVPGVAKQEFRHLLGRDIGSWAT